MGRWDRGSAGEDDDECEMRLRMNDGMVNYCNGLYRTLWSARKIYIDCSCKY